MNTTTLKPNCLSDCFSSILFVMNVLCFCIILRLFCAKRSAGGIVFSFCFTSLITVFLNTGFYPEIYQDTVRGS